MQGKKIPRAEARGESFLPIDKISHAVQYIIYSSRLTDLPSSDLSMFLDYLDVNFDTNISWQILLCRGLYSFVLG